MQATPPINHYRAIFISDVHLGTRGCQAELLLDFLKHIECDDALPGRRHHRRLAAEARLVLAAGAQRRGAEAAAQGAQGHARHLRPGQPRRVRCATSSAMRSAASTWSTRRSTSPPTAGGCWSCTATSSTASSSTRAGWRSLGDRAYDARACKLNHWFNRAARARSGFRYWSLSALPQAQGQERGRASSATSRTRWRARRARRGVDGVVCGHIHQAEMRDDRRHPLLQRRRLGRELHRAGRASRRAARDPRLGAPERQVAMLRARPQPAPPRAETPMQPRSSSPTPGRRRSTASCARCSAPGRAGAAGPRGRRDRARPVPHHPLPDLSGDPRSRCARRASVARQLDALAPDAIHIATEGPLGRAARAWCLQARPALHHRLSHALPGIRRGRASPSRWPGPTRMMRRFHAPAARLHGADASASRTSCSARGFANISALVARRRPRALPAATAPALLGLCRGRSSSTSAAWRSRRTSRRSSALDLPGTKVVVGDGPQLASAAGALSRRRISLRRQARRRAGAPCTPPPTCSSSPA